MLLKADAEGAAAAAAATQLVVPSGSTFQILQQSTIDENAGLNLSTHRKILPALAGKQSGGTVSLRHAFTSAIYTGKSYFCA